LCDAGTAGISLLDGDVFRWDAVAGVSAASRGGTMPRHDSPCGVCIDRNSTQLMHLPDRRFPALLTEPRFVEALLVPFHAHGKPIGTVWIVAHDFSRKFDKEDERLIGVVALFAAAGWQLWHAREEIAANSRRKDDFLATLGHEMRNPLSAITAAGAILQGRPHEPSVERAVGVIARQTKHISRLIDDLLDIARIGSGKLQLERRVVDLRTVVGLTVETRRAQIERRRQVLTVTLGTEPVWILADAIRVAQIVSNLVDNAAKYTEDNGHISVALSTEGDEVLLQVSDTGVGIPAERRQEIFQPFTQLYGSSGSFAGGLGLGLALVRSLTELHGGSVSVTSAGHDQGCCFTVRLPTESNRVPSSPEQMALSNLPPERGNYGNSN
ncbi:MAG: ATP-binding protein, partial [Vicinamibacterales bacterium]